MVRILLPRAQSRPPLEPLPSLGGVFCLAELMHLYSREETRNRQGRLCGSTH